MLQELTLPMPSPSSIRSSTLVTLIKLFSTVDLQINLWMLSTVCVGIFVPYCHKYECVFFFFFLVEKFVELLEAMPDLEVQVLRIYSSAVERKDFPGPKHQVQQALPDNSCPEWAPMHSLHHLIRDPKNKAQEFVALRKIEKELEDLDNANKIASGKLCSKYRQVLSDAEAKYLTSRKFDIVFCTCNEASGGRMKKHWRALSPRQCIIDECGMAYEPETIVPIALCEHAVLIGDHKQLQPVIEYQPAKDNGLAISLFERYAKYYGHHIYTLKTQYRMVSSVVDQAYFNESFNSMMPFVSFHQTSSMVENWKQMRVCWIVRTMKVWKASGLGATVPPSCLLMWWGRRARISVVATGRPKLGWTPSTMR